MRSAGGSILRQPALNFQLILLHSLADEGVHLQGLGEAEQVVIAPAPAELFGDFLLALLATPMPQLRHGAVDPNVHLIQAFLHAPQPVRAFVDQRRFVARQRPQQANPLVATA